MSDNENSDFENQSSDYEEEYSLPSNKKKPLLKIKSLEDDDSDEDMDNIDKTLNEIEESNTNILEGVDENDNDVNVPFINEEEDDDIVIDDDDDDDDDDPGENKLNNQDKQPQINGNLNNLSQLPIINDGDTDYYSEDDSDDDVDENYLQKFNSETNKNYIDSYHPECLSANLEEVSKLSRVVRDKSNIIVDPLHKTIPFLTKYEKARIIGQRCAQLDNGAIPFVKVPEDVIESYLIAEMELAEKKIPFIIKRPIPNGSFEYWNLKDLEIISY